MKISARLAMAFSALLAMLLAISWLAWRNTGVLHGAVGRVAREAEQGAAAAYEMEIRAFESGLAVLDYLETGRGAEEVRRIAAHFDRALAEYRAGADSGRERALAREIWQEFGRYHVLGLLLMEQRDRQERLFSSILERFDDLAREVRGPVLAAADTGPASRRRLVAEVAARLTASEAAVGNYLRLPDVDKRRRIERNERRVRATLASLEATAAGPTERDLLVALAARFDAVAADTSDLLRLHDEIREGTRMFFDYRAELNETLDDEIQVETSRDLRAAVARAAEAADESGLRVLVPLALAIVVAAAGYGSIRRSIVRPVAAMSAGARRVGEGDLSHRLEVRQGDELGGLAAAFNEMVARREAAEAEAARASQESRLILENAAEGIVWLDPNGSVRFANLAAARMLAAGPGDLDGSNLHELVHPDCGGARAEPEGGCPIRGVLTAQGAVGGAGERFFRADGSSFPVEYSATPVVEAGETTGVVLIFRDISERREMDRIKNEFVSVVSHELRTPLTSIRGAIGLLQSGALGEVDVRARRMIDIAVQNTDRLIRLINDILDVERLDSGRMELHRQRVDVEALMSESVDVMRAMATDAGIVLELDPVHAEVEADPDRIMQTLTNLLSNAIKFSRPGGVVRIGGERRAGDVVVRVSDEGRGIPQDKIERIFDRFQQVDASDSRRKGGTGLGLAICRSIVEQHGGRIWVESRFGAGSTFSFTLPLQVLSDDAGGEAEPVAPGAASVLVCDDDPAVLEVTATLLRRHGYRVVTADAVESAVALAVRERPDVILLDLLMPGVPGWELPPRLKEHEATKDVPVVIFSVLARGSQAPVGHEVAGWVDKGADEATLLGTLESVLRSAQVPRRVLVVEDDPDLARVLVAMFERHGVEVHRAATGADAVSVSGRVLPDLLVLDLALPGRDGFSVVDWLRRHDRLRLVPVMVYTARDLSPGDRERLRLGETEFATKGRISPEEFEVRVTELLDRVVPADARS